jgi:hypothetical protein
VAEIVGEDVEDDRQFGDVAVQQWGALPKGEVLLLRRHRPKVCLSAGS